MTKALFRKQMMEVFSWVYKNKKTGKLRSVSGIVGYILLYLFLFGILGFVFFFAALSAREPFQIHKICGHHKSWQEGLSHISLLIWI